MQADAKRQGGAVHSLKALLMHLQTPPEFERHTYRTSGIVLVDFWHPKYDEQAVTHGELEPPPIWPHHVVREFVKLLHHAVQRIEVETPTTCRRAGHCAAQDRDQLALGTGASQSRRRHASRRQRGRCGQCSHRL
jgi:hypothetical protein